MPLATGKSKAAFKKNVRTEVAAGRPVKQSVAIAYAVQRKNAKRAAHVVHHSVHRNTGKY